MVAKPSFNNSRKNLYSGKISNKFKVKSDKEMENIKILKIKDKIYENNNNKLINRMRKIKYPIIIQKK